MMSLLRRRMMMAAQEVEEMEEWRTLYEETLVEDKNITCNGFECTEIEAYVVFNTKPEGNLYFTTNDSGNIYGEPRSCLTFSKLSNIGIAKLALKKITPYLIETQQIYSLYLYNIDGVNTSQTRGYAHKNVNGLLSVDKFTEFSLVVDGANLKSGDMVFVRGR